jgi:hypothetical protein
MRPNRHGIDGMDPEEDVFDLEEDESEDQACPVFPEDVNAHFE